MKNKKTEEMVKLFNQLNVLANDPETTFHRIDTVSQMQSNFAIFGYHIASYSEWLLLGATESRGIMFEIDSSGNPIRIACRPMEKFWNYKENPFTENIKDQDVQYLFKKEDGSLISTFLDKGQLFVKSKGSLFSQQALDAQKWLYDPKRKPLFDAIKEYTEKGYTVNMEWCSPDNRIVLGYEEPRLIILNIRENQSGRYLSFESMVEDSQIRQFLVEPVEFTSISDLLENLKKLTNEEGYVGWLKNKPFFKLKCPWYVQLHSVKSEISSDRKLWESVANGVSDDIKILFNTDQLALDRISDFEKKYKKSFSDVYTIAIQMYNDLQGMSRKDYAINAQSKLNQIGKNELFSIVMRLYLQGEDESIIEMIKDHLIKYYELYLKV